MGAGGQESTAARKRCAVEALISNLRCRPNHDGGLLRNRWQYRRRGVADQHDPPACLVRARHLRTIRFMFRHSAEGHVAM